MKNASSKVLWALLITLLIVYVAFRLVRLISWLTPLLIEIIILAVAALCIVYLIKQHKINSKGES